VLLRIEGTHGATQAEPTSAIENTVSRKAVSHKVKLSQSGTIPYGLLVHAYSNLTFSPSLQQSNYEPGSVMLLHSTICESGVPLPAGKCSIWVDVTTPDSSHIILPLKEDYNSQFGVTFRSSIPGIYQFRIRASGRSRMGYPFQREKTLTGAVWYGGDNNRDFNNTGMLARLTGEQD
jgi:hypothetical protein